MFTLLSPIHIWMVDQVKHTTNIHHKILTIKIITQTE